MKFLGNVVATVVGLMLFMILGFLGLLVLGALLGGNGDKTIVESNSVLELKLDGITNDYGGKFSDPAIGFFSKGDEIGIIDILNAIDAAKSDDNIKGISILNSNSATGLAQSKAIRDALIAFKKSGKFVVSYANVFTQNEYYINSVADTIYLNPVGDMEFKGLSSEALFFKDFQDKTGINVEVIRHGKYKSAVEPFLQNSMSESNREQITSLLNSVWSSYVQDISESRRISVVRLNEIANGLLARTPEMAKAEKLVDRIAYEDEFHNGIRKALGVDKDEKYHKVDIRDYAQNVAKSPKNAGESDKIAIIYAQGNILSGEGSVNTIGEESMRRSLQEARNDDDVKAIVLRVDSPGGSALTSDLIWREIELTKKVKPVITSMGNTAASGGYYIACNSDQIFAEKNTITGSIGVFGILPNFSQLATKMGIHAEQVNTHENAANYSLFLPLDPKVETVLQEGVEHIYTVFVNRVAEGRKMSFAEVDSIAQGRVWTGEEAKKIGLVDQIGGLDAALKYAASAAKIKKYRTQDFPKYNTTLGEFFGLSPFMQTKEELIREQVGEENYKIIEHLRKVNALRGTQALLPFELIIM